MYKFYHKLRLDSSAIYSYHTDMHNKNTDNKIALVAGALDLPFFTRDALRRAGWDVFIVGLKNFVNPKLNPDLTVRLGGAGRAIREFRRRGIHKLVFVGSLGHPNLSDLRTDLWTFMTLLKIMKHQRGYDSMAVALNKVLEKQGFEILAAQDLAPELAFETAGVQTRSKPTKSDMQNIERAIEVSHTIGIADIGASVVVDKQVRKNKKKTSGVFAKMTKPGQDLRIDIPAIGVDTVDAVSAAHLRGIVVNTKTCFVVNKPAVIKRANELGIFILALDE